MVEEGQPAPDFELESGVHRYVWPASETHAYLLVKSRAPDGDGSIWVVRTVLETHQPLEATG